MPGHPGDSVLGNTEFAKNLAPPSDALLSTPGTQAREKEAARFGVLTHAMVLETFVSQYLNNASIRAALLVACSNDMERRRMLYASGFRTNPVETVFAALEDIVAGNDPFDLDRVVLGAASLELLTNYARELPAAIMPQDSVPSKEAVEYCMQLFHHVIADFKCCEPLYITQNPDDTTEV